MEELPFLTEVLVVVEAQELLEELVPVEDPLLQLDQVVMVVLVQQLILQDLV
tara:strand:+ start:491 stop:646 length:156 start_codon:yes stop_codon:yes gene_type:complete